MSQAPQALKSSEGKEAYLASWQATFSLIRRGASFSGNERNCAYLNTDGSRFANVSASMGLDFLDDSRAVAVADWDHDGDLDLWLRNRSGPRLRLMRNETSEKDTGHGFVGIRLRGVDCNRDAIGARVEVHLEGPSQGKLIQTLFAGDGYLSQSSKWLHFGLGTDPKIKSVTIRWPGGKMEPITGIVANRFYTVKQGSGMAVEWKTTQEALKLAPSVQPTKENTETTQAFLATRFPMPTLPYTSFHDSPEQPIETKGSPLLVSLWASWCIPCLAEIKEWTAEEKRLRDAGLNILALSVDGLGENAPTTSSDAQKYLADIGFPFESGVATIEAVDKAELVQEILFSWRRSINVPTSFLLDSDGQLAAIYRGPVPIDVLLNDVANLGADPSTLPEMSTRFPGWWYQPHEAMKKSQAAKWFSQNGYHHDVERYLRSALDEEKPNQANLEVAMQQRAENFILLGQSLQKMGRIDEAKETFRQAIQIDPDSVSGHMYLANVLIMQKQNLDEAMTHLRLVLLANPEDTIALYNLGKILEHQDKPDDAISRYHQVVYINPDDAEAHLQLGRLLGEKKQYDEATTHLFKVSESEIDNAINRNQLALYLLHLNRTDEAILQFQQAAQMQPGNKTVHNNLGSALASQGKLDEAAVSFREALAIDPNYADGNQNLGSVLRLQGKMDEAIFYYQKSLNLRPDNADDRYNLGKTLLLNGKAKEAVKHLRHALHRNTRSSKANAHYDLGRALSMTGDHDQAITHFHKAVHLNPDLADDVHRLGVNMDER